MTDTLKTTVAAATTATVQLAAMLALTSDDPARRDAARRYLAKALAEALDSADECKSALADELATVKVRSPGSAGLQDAKAYARGLQAMFVSVDAAIDLAIELAEPEIKAHAEQRAAATPTGEAGWVEPGFSAKLMSGPAEPEAQSSGGLRGLSTDEAAWVEPSNPKDPR